MAPFTVRRTTLRVLVGMGYVETMFDAGLFLSGQSFALTACGKRAIQTG